MSEPTFGMEVVRILGKAGHDLTCQVCSKPLFAEQAWAVETCKERPIRCILFDPREGLDSETAAAVCKAEPGLCARDRNGGTFKWDGSRWMFWADPWEPLRGMRDYEPGGDLADAPFRLVHDPGPVEAQAPLAEAQRLTTAYLVGDRYDPKTGRHVLDMAGDILKTIAEEES